MEDTPEDTLIAGGKQGDRDAIAELFRRHYARSLKLASGILHHQDDAQDAVQAAYFLAFRELKSFRGDSSFKTWITRIVVNCCLLQLRNTRHRMTWIQVDDRPDVLASPAPNPEKSAWSGEIAAALSNAVSSLPKNLQEAYTLFTISGLSLQEVASSLGLTVSATKTRLFRARAGIRMSLQPFCPSRSRM
jgi:RNA polymerase sigma-70 factor, ECF subfamily